MNENTTNYMMLGRLQRDCNFYLGFGMRNADYALYCKDEKEQINEMLKIYNELPLKPLWLKVADILQYAEQMNVNIKHKFLLKTTDLIIRTWQKIRYWKELYPNHFQK